AAVRATDGPHRVRRRTPQAEDGHASTRGLERRERAVLVTQDDPIGSAEEHGAALEAVHPPEVAARTRREPFEAAAVPVQHEWPCSGVTTDGPHVALARPPHG